MELPFSFSALNDACKFEPLFQLPVAINQPTPRHKSLKQWFTVFHASVIENSDKAHYPMDVTMWSSPWNISLKKKVMSALGAQDSFQGARVLVY